MEIGKGTIPRLEMLRKSKDFWGEYGSDHSERFRSVAGSAPSAVLSVGFGAVGGIGKSMSI